MKKSAARSILLAFLVILFALVVYAGSLAAGWLPVPSFVTGWYAQAKGLTPAQARSLDRTVNVYRVLKSAPEAPLVDQALKLAAQGSDTQAWMAFAAKAWPQLTPETKEKVREQLGVTPEDFQALEAIADRQMKILEKEGSFQLTEAEAERLNQFDRDYGILETLEKLR